MGICKTHTHSKYSVFYIPTYSNIFAQQIHILCSCTYHHIPDIRIYVYKQYTILPTDLTSGYPQATQGMMIWCIRFSENLEQRGNLRISGRTANPEIKLQLQTSENWTYEYNMLSHRPHTIPISFRPGSICPPVFFGTRGSFFISDLLSQIFFIMQRLSLRPIEDLLKILI